MNIEKIREALDAAQEAMEGAHHGPHSFLPGQLRKWLSKRAEALAELDKVQQPAAGLTVEEAHEVFEKWQCDSHTAHGAFRGAVPSLHARLTAAINAKDIKQ